MQLGTSNNMVWWAITDQFPMENLNTGCPREGPEFDQQ